MFYNSIHVLDYNTDKYFGSVSLSKDVREPIVFRHFHDPLFHDQNPHIPAKPLK